MLLRDDEHESVLLLDSEVGSMFEEGMSLEWAADKDSLDVVVVSSVEHGVELGMSSVRSGRSDSAGWARGRAATGLGRADARPSLDG